MASHSKTTYRLHFLYEGLVKVLNSGWTAYPYLMDSQGIFEEYFYNIANNSTLLTISNYINIVALTLIGLCLIVGLFSKYASIGGIIVLTLYFLSHHPFIGADHIMPAEGSYLWIDKNIIEISALMVLVYFPTSHIIGFDRFIQKYFSKK